MGAVRNSNTRASHASVEAAGTGGGSTGAGGANNNAPGGASGGGIGLDGTTKQGASGSVITSSTAGNVADSPHLGPDTPDRRPSFSYLRRASDRRRRRRMLERSVCGDVDDIGSPRQTYREFVYPRSHHAGTSAAGPGNRHGQMRESESGQDSDNALSRRDSGNQQGSQHDQQHHRSLRRSDQIYDEEAAEQLYGHQVEAGGVAGPEHVNVGDDEDDDNEYKRFTQQHHLKQQPPISVPHQAGLSDEQRRQSINDRLTDAVSDVMEFVRDESYKRGKRRSLVRRRCVGGQGGAGGAAAGSGSGTAGGPTDDAEFDSEDISVIQERSPNYRRKRTLRRSLRRNNQPTRTYNDSDTGSGASLSHEQGISIQHQQQLPPAQPLAQPINQQVQMMQHPNQMAQRYKLQQHGGSVQDSNLLYGSRGNALLIDQHRRHQSADACAGQPGPINDPYYKRSAGMLDQGGEYCGLPTGAPVIRPILVGSSPPPMVGSADADLAAARRKREEEVEVLDDDQETAIHVTSGTEFDVDSKNDQSPGRFIAPKVAPLSSPSALLIPDEEIIPPNVPFRGRRLPQIPGSNIIKTATDFLHSSIHGRPTSSSGLGQTSRSVSVAGTTGAVAATPLVVAGAASRAFGPYSLADPQDEQQESVFPSVSESPTIKLDSSPIPVPQTAGIIKKQPTPLETGSGLGGSGSINFPRVSFSPTHAQTLHSSTAVSKYHMASGGSVAVPTTMIATQQVSGGPTQSSVMGSSASPADALVSHERAAALGWTRGRRREDKDNWF